MRCDLRSYATPMQIFSTTLTAFGPHIDIVIKIAGCTATTPLATLTPASFTNIHTFNALAPLFLTQATPPHLRSPGRVINFSSVDARVGVANLSAYCSCKAAVEGLTRCWPAESGPQGHTVSARHDCRYPKEVGGDAEGGDAGGEAVGDGGRGGKGGWLVGGGRKWVGGQCIRG